MQATTASQFARFLPTAQGVLILVLGGFPCCLSYAQDSTEEPDLASTEAMLAERFDRLEMLAGRLAELSRSTQPRRAELLRELVAKSRAQEMHRRFAEVADSLRKDRLAEAIENQGTLQRDLQAMLDLLLQEDRNRQIESERKRISKYLAELNKLIRQQRGIKARTSGGDGEQELAGDQQRTADATSELHEKIASTEGRPQSSTTEHASSQDSQDSAGGEGRQKDAPGASGDARPDGSSPNKSADGEGKPSEGSSSDGDSGQAQGSPSGQGSQGSSPQGSPSESGESNPQPTEEQQQRPADNAMNRLQQAQQRMLDAQERLEKAQRDKAVEQQESALRELEQAKAELEKILRQLREEEMERMLVLLESRLRKMLEAQNQVYEQTLKLDKSSTTIPAHEMEITSATLARKEDQIVGEADRALLLLREDGTSVAFPEALQQAREDMRTVAGRLRNVKPDEITIGLEEDIIATLEETLSALQQALKDVRQQRSSQQPGSGEPGEQPLVDQLAELRMIRALQNRVNGRTKFYDALIEGERALETDLRQALDRLAERQERIFEATRDLYQGANQ